MKVTIEATAVVIEGIGRVWNGVTEKGVRCQVLVAGIASETDADVAALQCELAALVGLGSHVVGSITIRDANGRD